MENEKEIVINIETEKGNFDCSVITTFAMNNNLFIALLPIEGDTEKVLLFKYNELSEDQIVLINIEDNSEFEQALEIFDGLMINADNE